MAYRFKRGEPVADGVLRIVRSQTSRALSALGTGFADDPLTAVFECRKRCKKVRAAARLVRPLLGSEYDEVNRCYREAGRLLAIYRDPHARLAGLDKLLVEGSGAPPQLTSQLASLRVELAKEAERNLEQLLQDADLLGRVDELLRVGELRLDRWKITASGWDAIGPGLARNYGQGQAALALARSDPTPFNIHEFRKYAKYLRNHIRLIEPASKEQMRPLLGELRELTTTLGDAHDLAELSERLQTRPPSSGDDGEIAPALTFLGERQQRLEQEGLAMGSLLFADAPDQLTARLGVTWDCWRNRS